MEKYTISYVLVYFRPATMGLVEALVDLVSLLYVIIYNYIVEIYRYHCFSIGPILDDRLKENILKP